MKKTKTVLVIVVAVFVFAYLFVQENPQLFAEKQSDVVAIDTKQRVITGDFSLKMSMDVNAYDESFVIKGTTNLPEGTKLGFSSYNNGNVNAQNFDVYVANQTFESQFGIPVNKCDEVHVSCYNTEIWQTEQVLEQLRFLKYPEWTDEQIEMTLNVDSACVASMKDYLGVIDAYKPLGTQESVRDYSMPQRKRYAAVIIYKNQPDPKELINDMNYQVLQVWKKHRDANNITLQCFESDEDLSFISLTYIVSGTSAYPQ